MKIQRKICLLLCLILLFGFMVKDTENVDALEKDSFDIDMICNEVNLQIDLLKNNCNNFNFEIEDIDELFLGRPIVSYEIVDGSVKQLNYISYPVFLHENIIFLLL